MSATTNLGKVSVTPKGAWANTNTYEILDIVTSGGSSYLAKQDVPTGVPLSNTSYWIMIAEKGDGGEVTSASASISGGYGTPGVTVTAGGTAHERTLAFAFTNLRGEKGETGNGIDSVYKTGTSGLVDTYTILFTDGSTYEFEVNNGTASIDDTLTKSGWAADAKAVGDTKASIDGFYETMGVGVADNLTPYSEDSGASQDIPFIAQGTGCGNGESVVDTGSYFQFKKKLGNTVAVNQGVKNGEFTSGTSNWQGFGSSIEAVNGELHIYNGTGSYPGASTVIPWIQGHSVLLVFTIRGKVGGESIYMNNNAGTNTQIIPSLTTSKTQFARIFTPSSTNTTSLTTFFTNGQSNEFYMSKVFTRDLTLWFGSNDRIPADLLAHPENWGRYYAGSLAYNAGTLESADGTVMKSIGRNIWNENWQYSNTLFGAWCIESVDIIPVSPNSEIYAYCSRVNFASRGLWFAFYDAEGNLLRKERLYGTTFTMPSDAHGIRIGVLTSYYGETVYKYDTTLSLYYSGESGYSEYYPYSVLAEVDTGSEVLRSAGAVADEKTPDGTITRRVGVVDLGTLNWGYSNIGAGVYAFYTTGIASSIKPGSNMLNLHCPKYTTTSQNGLYSGDKIIADNTGGNVYVVDSAYTDAATFKAAMSGVYLYYELATPTTEQGTAFAENIPCDDFGSMYWTQTKGIPQGNEIFYPVDYKASIDTLYNRVGGDMGAIVIDSQLEVVADRIPEAPSEDGTYTLKATVSSGTKTYSWVADE